MTMYYIRSPVQICLLYTSQNVESAVYGHLGTSNLAAYTLTGPIQALIVGALSGLSAAAGVIVGKRLGRKEYDEAYTESKKIMYCEY